MITLSICSKKSNHQKITILCNCSIHKGGIRINQICIHMLTIDTHLLAFQFEVLLFEHTKYGREREREKE